MADTISKENRSRNMAAIRNRNTKPEVYLRKLLFSRGYRYRKNDARIIGHPDMYLSKFKVAIFVNGCFWHRHQGCKYAYMPKSHVDFWKRKFCTNIQRDKTVRLQLQNDGIRCLTVWECTVRKMLRDAIYEKEVLDAIESFMADDLTFMEIPDSHNSQL